jgi:hypothetical protein
MDTPSTPASQSTKRGSEALEPDARTSPAKRLRDGDHTGRAARPLLALAAPPPPPPFSHHPELPFSWSYCGSAFESFSDLVVRVTRFPDDPSQPQRRQQDVLASIQPIDGAAPHHDIVMRYTLSGLLRHFGLDQRVI